MTNGCRKQVTYLHYSTSVNNYHNSFLTYFPPLPQQTTLEFSKRSAARIEKIQEQEYLRDIRLWDSEVRRNKYINGSSLAATRYITFMARYLDDLKKAQSKLQDEIR